MNLLDLEKKQELIVQIVWGDKVIEFYTKVVDYDDEGIFIEPYLHNGMPLELNIDMKSVVVCHLFGDNLNEDKRVSWRNVNLNTVERNRKTTYKITTSVFNKSSNDDERRTHKRIVINKKGTLIIPKDNLQSEVYIHDISDNGISFFVPINFQPTSKYFNVHFSDSVNGNSFNAKAECRIVHTSTQDGTLFYGCEVVDANRDYMIYGCLSRVIKKSEKYKEMQEQKNL